MAAAAIGEVGRGDDTGELSRAAAVGATEELERGFVTNATGELCCGSPLQGRWMAQSRGAVAAGCEARTPPVAALGRSSIICPRMGGSDLREARTAAASAAAEGAPWRAAGAWGIPNPQSLGIPKPQSMGPVAETAGAGGTETRTGDAETVLGAAELEVDDDLVLVIFGRSGWRQKQVVAPELPLLWAGGRAADGQATGGAVEAGDQRVEDLM